MIYIASPYTDSDPEIRQCRYEAVRAFAADSIKQGWYAYSPIVNCHPMAEAHDLPKDFAFWQMFDKHMIDIAEQFWVLMLPGWSRSRGLTMELAHAHQKFKTIRYWICAPVPEDPDAIRFVELS